jgi:hypothetical protein
LHDVKSLALGLEHSSAPSVATSVKPAVLAEIRFVQRRRASDAANGLLPCAQLPQSSGLCAALAVTISVIAGCGGTSVSAGGDATGPSAAYARAVNLRTGDVPGSVVARVWDRGVAVGLERERTASTPPFDARIERCDGGVTIVPSREVVAFRSPNFTRGLATASPAQEEGTWSVVFVFASEGAANHELSVLASPRAQACFRRDGDTSIPGSETHLQASSVQATPGFGIHGVSWSAIPSSYSPPTRRYQDLLAFRMGRALITLHTLGTPHPFLATLEARLLRLLYGRATAHEVS